MRNWPNLAVEPYRQRNIKGYESSRFDGPNGCFQLPGLTKGRNISVLASDGGGWEHVSVSMLGDPSKLPTWEEMCYVKDLFWNDDEVVMQLHPAKADYVNVHAGTLHLWRPIPGEAEIPLPPKNYV
jgi:hypothetical protein